MKQTMKRAEADYRRMVVLAVLLVVTMAWNINAGRAQSFQPLWGHFLVLQFHRCLDADANNGADGTEVQLWDCWNGENQRWVMNYDNTIVNVRFNKCLSAFHGGNGTRAVLWDCLGDNGQQWNFTLDGNLVNYAFPSQCLDADNTNGGNGTIVQIWNCSNGPNQKWWNDIQMGFPINVAASNRCLDADESTIVGNGTNVQLWDCNGGPNQSWNMLSDGTIRNLQSHRCLDADTNTIGQNGTKVQLWGCWGAQNQFWLNPGMTWFQ